MATMAQENIRLLPRLRRSMSTISGFTTSSAPLAQGGQSDEHLTADDESILYEDNYIQVSQEGLLIKRYWFPALNSTFIRWHTIEYVKTAREANVKWYEVKDWGPAFGNICWALKLRLIARKQAGSLGIVSLNEILDTNIVVKVRGKWIRPGAYVECPSEAMRMIRRMLVGNHQHAD